jgi:hypothetical protein
MKLISKTTKISETTFEPVIVVTLEIPLYTLKDFISDYYATCQLGGHDCLEINALEEFKAILGEELYNILYAKG